MKIAWVTDSTAAMDDVMQNHPDVYIVPITILLDEQEYIDGVDLTPAALYETLKSIKAVPKTSQPSIGTFQQLFEKLGETYDAIIAVHLSEKLSGTVSSCKQAAELVKIPVYTIDSGLISYPLTWLVKKGMQLAEQELQPEQITTKLESLKHENELYVLIGSLEQLHRSGRMNGLQFFLGSVLQITPIISLEQGQLNTKEKVRSKKKAQEKMINYLKTAYEQHELKEAFILYGLHREIAEEWKRTIEMEIPGLVLNCYPLGAAVGLHAGEDTLGISWFNKQ
ncbi:DegV family protein [Cytobacillus gottheilii]|uniref:DegV family protein n=1 Tax=Cytobacillus gottheilii TaxID=859144 RepID=UPI0034644C75